jgi:predicted RNA binding protein YcfA (HicA-like mRNA interferase family)
VRFPSHVWSQLKNKTADDLVAALKRDGWERDICPGAIHTYLHPVTRKRVGIHYHPKKTFGPKLLQDLLDDIGWTEGDLRRLKLIK